MSQLQIELNGALERLNANLEPSGYFMKIGHRNGYTALDLHFLSTGGCKDIFTSEPSDRKMLERLYLMSQAIELTTNPAKK